MPYKRYALLQISLPLNAVVASRVNNEDLGHTGKAYSAYVAQQSLTVRMIEYKMGENSILLFALERTYPLEFRETNPS